MLYLIIIIITIKWEYRSVVEIGLYVALYVFFVLIFIDSREDVAMNDIVYFFPQLGVAMRLK